MHRTPFTVLDGQTFHSYAIGTPMALLCRYTAEQLATQLQQRRIQVVRSNKVGPKNLSQTFFFAPETAFNAIGLCHRNPDGIGTPMAMIKR